MKIIKVVIAIFFFTVTSCDINRREPVRTPDEVWPNSPNWSALADGSIVKDDDGTEIHISVVDCGILIVSSGKLVACDPFAAMRKTENPYVNIPPGDYTVLVTLADVSGKGDGSHIREAYATLVLSDKPEVVRRTLSPSPSGTVEQDLAPEEFIGFPVDAGTACFVDPENLEQAMPEENKWYDELFDSGESESWFNQMDSPDNIREGIANIRLPLAKSHENLILFHSGWGDGLYPVVGGFGQNGELVKVHIDFAVL